MSKFEMYPTIITPFRSGGQIDWESLENSVNLFADTGCEGIFAVCQSSEMFFLSEEEKLTLAQRTLTLCRAHGMKCVISGHTQDEIDCQIRYLTKLEEMKPDAIILVSNRFARADEDDEIAVINLRRVLAALRSDTLLGVYECPYPYKRDLSPALLDVMVRDGRFRFIKDTSCKIDVIKARLSLIQNTDIALYNANMATLLESMDAGAAGYSGVMLNILPELFALLHEAFQQNERARAEAALSVLSALSTIECQNYPANAKYVMMKRGAIQTTLTRNGRPPLTESQMKELDAFIEMSRYLYYSLLKHASYELITGYDVSFPECHASTVLPLNNGNVLVVYFAGTREGADDVGIWLSARIAGVWQKPRRIAKVNESAHWNPVIFPTDAGARVVFKVGKTIPKWESYAILSTDGGETWSEPERFTADNPAGGPVRNKPIALASGVLLAPNSDETPDTWLPRVDISSDSGKSFQKYASIPINREDPSKATYMPGLGAIQPTLWESAPGKVHALLRTNAGLIYRSDSEDGGKTWCVAYPTPLPNNNSGIDLAEANGALYLVMNPVGSPKGARTPLIVMKSTDNGARFTDFITLTDDPVDDHHNRAGQFCYPAIAARGNRLYITYTHNRKSIAFSEIRLS